VNPAIMRSMKQAISNGDLMTVSEVARVLLRSEGAVRAAATRGDLDCTRTSTGLRLFRRQDIERIAGEAESATVLR